MTNISHILHSVYLLCCVVLRHIDLESLPLKQHVERCVCVCVCVCVSSVLPHYLCRNVQHTSSTDPPLSSLFDTHTNTLAL